MLIKNYLTLLIYTKTVDKKKWSYQKQINQSQIWFYSVGLNHLRKMRRNRF